jgi:D-alanyl-D-alanine carboxypeptidase
VSLSACSPTAPGVQPSVAPPSGSSGPASTDSRLPRILPSTDRGVTLPPAYLAWTSGGFERHLQPALSTLPGVTNAVVVAGDTAWLSSSTDANGRRVDAPPQPFRIPLETFAVDPAGFDPFVPPAYRDQVMTALERGRAVLGSSSAELRRLGVGGTLRFEGGVRVTVGAVVPDPVAGWSEVLVSRAVGSRLGVSHDRFALLAYAGRPTVHAVEEDVRVLLPPDPPLRIRAPGHALFRRHADSVWPQVLMKLGFGEFAARPSAGNPAYLDVDPTWVKAEIATRRVDLLGPVTCNVELFPALDAAMDELRRRGLSSLVRSFSGCYAARTVQRVATAPLSHHSWGAAVDINAPQNPYGARPTQDPRLVAVMEAHGFTWGGRWTVPDGMHFEFVEPATTP